MSVRERNPKSGKQRGGAKKQEQRYPGSEKQMKPKPDHGEELPAI